jgi:hypothetical protein
MLMIGRFQTRVNAEILETQVLSFLFPFFAAVFAGTKRSLPQA